MFLHKPVNLAYKINQIKINGLDTALVFLEKIIALIIIQ
jgi:hypothetical protein